MRIALGIEYNGTLFSGWQFQKHALTVEGALQEALSQVADEPIFLNCAGRTDAGVHAVGQVIHFDTKAKRHVDAWLWGTNTHLPESIAVRWSRQVDYHFHARFKAISRKYRYIILNQAIRPALLSKRVTWHYYPLHVESMQAAVQYLIGEQDFSSFRGSQCQSKSPNRCVLACQVERVGDFVFIDIEANAFLHHMVRNIAGVLMKIGGGFKEVSWMQEVLQAKDRRAAAETASPDGLYLLAVKYPPPYDFPLIDEKMCMGALIPVAMRS